MKQSFLLTLIFFVGNLWADAPSKGWETHSPRKEIRPKFAFKDGVFSIDAKGLERATGQWKKAFPVEGGSHYRFFAKRRTANMDSTRRGAVVRLIWQNEKGGKAVRDEPSFASYRPGTKPRSEPEFPRDKSTDKDGWTEVSDVFKAPKSRMRRSRG